MSIHLYVCVCLAERSSRQVVVVSGSFLSETGEAAALVRFPLQLGSGGGGTRKRSGVQLIKVSHCLNSSHTHQFAAVFIAGRLSHKCHTNLYTSHLMSKPVRYTTGRSSLTLLMCVQQGIRFTQDEPCYLKSPFMQITENIFSHLRPVLYIYIYILQIL